MTTTHVFVDESKRSDYLLAAATLRSQDLGPTRRAMSGLLLKGQSRLHMVKERPARQRLVLSTIATTPVTVTIYRAAQQARSRERLLRRHCFDHLVADLAHLPDTRLAVELDETLLGWDRASLYAATRRERCSQRMTYVHARASTEALLAVPDAIAWAWGQGGDWRRRAEGAVGRVVEVGRA